ncbi:MAG: hypothetical protein JST23_14020 [Bacteroidetes bacterium]|nr:hypothetical protein [Bacteroidota bacterium]
MKKSFLILGTLFILLSNLSAQVIVYKDKNFAGKSHSYGEGGFDLSGTIGNKTLSSIKIPSGWKVAVYYSYSDESRPVEFTSDVKDLAKVQLDNKAVFIQIDRVAVIETKSAVIESKVATVSNNTLNAAEALATGKQLTSENGKFILKMQDDGHLCAYKFDNAKQGAFVWGTGVYGFNNAKLVLQNDGSLVVLDGNNKIKWSSKTDAKTNANFKDSKNKPAKLVLENDGSIGLYNATGKKVWSKSK